LLSTAEGGKEAGGPETAPSAVLRPPVLHAAILNPPERGRREPEKALPGGDVQNLLDSSSALRIPRARLLYQP